GVSIVRKTPSHRFDPWAPVAPLAAKNNGFVRLASLESGVASRAGGLPFDRFASFNDRFRGAAEPFAPDAADAGDGQTRALLPADGAAETAPLGPRRRPEVTLARLAPATAPKSPEGRTGADSPSDVDSRTAIYDITAHTVYLPDGRRLEAHSGLGDHLDDPRFINVKHRGPT